MPILSQPRFSIKRPFGREPDSVRRVRAAWISDVHLGTRGANAGALLDFLREYEFETLYVVGDLIDIWQLRRSIYWPQQHNDAPNYVGSEIDLLITYQPVKSLVFWVGYSHFFAGSYVCATGPCDDADFGYAQATVNF